jgi:chromosome segregation ATPase
MQERDAFGMQLDALREKIAALSRELAEGQDDGAAKSTQLQTLRGQLADVEESNRSLCAAKAALEEKVGALEQELSRESVRAADLDAKAKGLQERSGAAERAWKHEKLLLSQVVIPCTLRSHT